MATSPAARGRRGASGLGEALLGGREAWEVEGVERGRGLLVREPALTGLQIDSTGLPRRHSLC